MLYVSLHLALLENMISGLVTCKGTRTSMIQIPCRFEGMCGVGRLLRSQGLGGEVVASRRNVGGWAVSKQNVGAKVVARQALAGSWILVFSVCFVEGARHF